nr:rhodanese-like domain-containing protein [Bacteroidia bacterium]
VLDVRKFTETEAGHVKGASILPLADLKSNLASVSKNETVYIHCAGGYRSMIAASMMKASGYPNVINVYGGWSLIKDEDVPVETGRVAPKSI